MNQRSLAILGGVALALVAILIFKPRASTAPEVLDIAQAQATVLLFADPREAESSCACAEIIRVARGAAELDGVTFQEHDPRVATELMKKHGVRVVPTVLILDSEGGESSRFEGESAEVVTQVDQALTALAATP